MHSPLTHIIHFKAWLHSKIAGTAEVVLCSQVTVTALGTYDSHFVVQPSHAAGDVLLLF